MLIGIVSADYLRGDQAPDGVDHWGGAGWARYGQYIPYLEVAGHTVITGVLWEENNTLAVENSQGNRALPDLILSQRLMHKNLDRAYRIGRKCGQIIVNDVDDWYWGLDPANEAWKATHPKHSNTENTTFYKASLGASSYITVSTPYLAERLGQWYKGEIVVLSNYVDTSRFTVVPITDTDVPEVGWAGSTSHRSGDVETLKGIIAPMARAGKIKLVHAGSYEHSPTFASQLGVEDELISRLTPRVGTEDYPSLLDFEVGLVAMRDTPFNESKSYIKGLEYAASGIPFVAPKFGEYKRLHEMWSQGGLLPFFAAKKPIDWIKAIETMRSSEIRLQMQQNLLWRVSAHDIALGAKQFVSYLESLVPR